MAVAAHELLSRDLAGDGIYLSRRRIVDGNQIPVRVLPVAKIPLPLFHRRDAQNRSYGAAPNPKAFVIEKEIGLMMRTPDAREFQRAANAAAKIILEILRSFGY